MGARERAADFDRLVGDAPAIRQGWPDSLAKNGPCDFDLVAAPEHLGEGVRPAQAIVGHVRSQDGDLHGGRRRLGGVRVPGDREKKLASDKGSDRVRERDSALE